MDKNQDGFFPDEDAEVLTKKIMPFFGISRVKVDYDPSKSGFPDIWTDLKSVPTITVTDEWKRQTASERQKRLVHEVLHSCGLVHNKRIGYTSEPSTDTLSKRVYDVIMKQDGQQPKMLKLSKNLMLRRRK